MDFTPAFRCLSLCKKLLLPPERLCPTGGLSATATLKEVAIPAFFPVPGVPNLYVIRFPTGKGQEYLVEECTSLDDESSWVGIHSVQGSGITLTHTHYSDSPNSYFRVRVLSKPPSI